MILKNKKLGENPSLFFWFSKLISVGFSFKL